MNILYTPKSNLEKYAHKLFLMLVENSAQTFYVGGMVRDMIIQKPIRDIDIATNILPERIIEILIKNKIPFDDQYKKLGIIIAQYRQAGITITTFRKDKYSEGRYPVITPVKTAEEDAKRRDFTVNALYYNQMSGEILDFFNGLEDITNKTLSFIGKPSRRIKEDPLRIIRALRFAVTLGFHFEKNTLESIKENFFLVKNLSESRIEKEILKIKNKKQQTILQEVINNPKTLDNIFVSL